MRLTALSLGLVFLTLLSACGVKPGNVDAPQGQAQDSFPRTYPQTSETP